MESRLSSSKFGSCDSFFESQGNSKNNTHGLVSKHEHCRKYIIHVMWPSFNQSDNLNLWMGCRMVNIPINSSFNKFPPTKKFLPTPSSLLSLWILQCIRAPLQWDMSILFSVHYQAGRDSTYTIKVGWELVFKLYPPTERTHPRTKDTLVRTPNKA